MPQDMPPAGGYGAVQYKVCATVAAIALRDCPETN